MITQSTLDSLSVLGYFQQTFIFLHALRKNVDYTNTIRVMLLDFNLGSFWPFIWAFVLGFNLSLS